MKSNKLYRNSQEYKESEVFYVTTGGPVPDFFNAVIPIEETELVEEGKIKILKQMSENQFIRAKGSDI